MLWAESEMLPYRLMFWICVSQKGALFRRWGVWLGVGSLKVVDLFWLQLPSAFWLCRWEELPHLLFLTHRTETWRQNSIFLPYVVLADITVTAMEEVAE